MASVSSGGDSVHAFQVDVLVTHLPAALEGEDHGDVILLVEAKLCALHKGRIGIYRIRHIYQRKNNRVLLFVDVRGAQPRLVPGAAVMRHAQVGAIERAWRRLGDGTVPLGELAVDAYDGPQAQTRFVLRKALAHGLKVVIVINKIDRDNADPAKMYDKVLELLMELNATEEQFDAPVVYEQQDKDKDWKPENAKKIVNAAITARNVMY